MRRRGHRGRTLVLTVAVVITIGAILQWVSNLGIDQTASVGPSEYQPVGSPQSSGNPAPSFSDTEVARRFTQGVTMLHANRYEHAVTAFHSVLARAPRLVEAHVNMGFAMLGLSHHRMARDFFENAIAIRPSQANAYYGLAMASEDLGDLAGAARAMRVFVHLSPADDPFLRKANSALWEWTSILSSQPDAKPIHYGPLG
jgi:tetratricopeptide (TPR) repeat protein